MDNMRIAPDPFQASQHAASQSFGSTPTGILLERGVTIQRHAGHVVQNDIDGMCHHTMGNAYQYTLDIYTPVPAKYPSEIPSPVHRVLIARS